MIRHGLVARIDSTMLRSVFALHADCSLGAYAEMRLTNPPAHGQAAVAAFYESEFGYVGPDSLTLGVVTAEGGDRILDYHLP